MGNAIDWSALPLLVELYGIDDVEQLLVQLIVIRDHMNARSAPE
jgi:hypothetical protein